MEPREYQNSILETAKSGNTLVVLPTGMGKTLIAFLLAKHYIEKYPKKKVLFLAPTRPLAQQHFTFFKDNLPELYAELQLFTGKIESDSRAKLWDVANIIFSTPQCIANDLKKRKISLDEVSLLIEDEAHRCLKNYDYTYIARRYLENQTDKENKRILAMTASPGSDSKTIKEICDNLGIQKIELRNRESEDVKPYIKELKTDLIKVDFPENLANIRDIIREIYNKKIEELKNRMLLFGPASKKNLLELQGKLARQISNGNTNVNVLRGISVCAQAIKLNHAIELLETQGVSQTHGYMQDIINAANRGESKASKQIANNKDFMKAHVMLTSLIGIVEHPKLIRLKELVQEEMKNNPKSRFIIFGQFRDTVAMINKMLNNQIPGIKSKVFVGQLKKEDTGMSQKEQQQVLAEFREGMINTLTSTSIGEEGLDLPEVSCVIFYEPIPSAIRKIQRAGRTARLKPGKLFILMTLKTRDEINHWTAHYKEKRMNKILGEMKDNMDKKEEKQQQAEEVKQKQLTSFDEVL